MAFSCFLIARPALATKQDLMIQEIEKSQAALANTANTAAVISRPKVEYDIEQLRDPFQEYEKKQLPGAGAVAVEKVRPALTVNGIIAGTAAPMAIINNKVVRQGETIEDAKVIKIDKSGVDLVFDGAQWRLPSPLEESLSRINLKKGEKNEKKP